LRKDKEHKLIDDLCTLRKFRRQLTSTLWSTLENAERQCNSLISKIQETEKQFQESKIQNLQTVSYYKSQLDLKETEISKFHQNIDQLEFKLKDISHQYDQKLSIRMREFQVENSKKTRNLEIELQKLREAQNFNISKELNSDVQAK
jgi:hypothetical protein